MDLSTKLYLLVVPHTADVPGIALVSVLGGAILLAGFGWATFDARRRGSAALGLVAATAAGVLLASLVSVVIKVLVAQDRPCRTVVELASCPEVGDWSFPSNHTVVVFALATSIAVIGLRGSWWWMTVALVVGVGRVTEGVHYPHDVLVGALIGVGTVLLAAALLGPDCTRLAAAISRQAWARTLLIRALDRTGDNAVTNNETQ